MATNGGIDCLSQITFCIFTGWISFIDPRSPNVAEKKSLPSKEPVLHYAGSKDHLTLLLSGLKVENIPHFIILYVRSLVPYISHITIMCWTLNVWKRGRGIMHSLYLHLPYIGCTHVPGTHTLPDPCHIV